MITSVDCSVLLDVIGADPQFGEASREALKRAYESGSLVACEVVWAEVAAHFPDSGRFRAAMTALGVRFLPATEQACVLAGSLWRRYCVTNPRRSRKSLVVDFLIGAHALLQADALLTRDRGFYRSCFSDLTILDAAEGR